MKKLVFLAMAILAMATAFTSCEKKSSNDDNKDKKSFTITYSDLQPTSVKVSVMPADTLMPYMYGITMAKFFEADSLQPQLKRQFDAVLQIAKALGYESSYADFCKTGNIIDGSWNILSNTEFVIYAVGLDTNTLDFITPIETVRFTSPAIDIKGKQELTLEGLLFNDEVANHGWWQIWGSYGYENDFHYLTVSPESTSQVDGTYSMFSMDEKYTFMRHIVISGTDTTFTTIRFVEGTFQVKKTDVGADMEAVVIGDDAIEYTLHVTSITQESTQDEDEELAPVRRKGDAVEDGLLRQQRERMIKRAMR